MPFQGIRYRDSAGNPIGGPFAGGAYEARINDLQVYLEGLTAAFDQGGVVGGGAALTSGSGAPTAAANQGDLYFRTDTPTTANQRIYICVTGGSSPVWTGIL